MIVYDAVEWLVLDNLKSGWHHLTNICNREKADEAYKRLTKRGMIADGKITDAGLLALMQPNVDLKKLHHTSTRGGKDEGMAKKRIMWHRCKDWISDYSGHGQRWAFQWREVRVMSEAEGYAMVRRKGAMPYVAPLKELFAERPPDTPALDVEFYETEEDLLKGIGKA